MRCNSCGSFLSFLGTDKVAGKHIPVYCCYRQLTVRDKYGIDYMFTCGKGYYCKDGVMSEIPFCYIGELGKQPELVKFPETIRGR